MRGGFGGGRGAAGGRGVSRGTLVTYDLTTPVIDTSSGGGRGAPGQSLYGYSCIGLHSLYKAEAGGVVVHEVSLYSWFSCFMQSLYRLVP